jgi:hypothetical protein
MKRKVEDWSIEKLVREHPRISFPDYQREPHLWSLQEKGRLIDSILQNIDIPKLYFNRTVNGDFEAVDGQQRLWAIWGFLADEYECRVDGKLVKFSQLSPAKKAVIRNFTLQVTVLEDAEEEYLRLLFLRLQLGLLLITGEKLHAASGAMKDLVFNKLAHHQFIKNLGIPAKRFAKETLCAQIAINSFTRAKIGKFARTRYEDLEQFFLEYAHPQAKDLEFFRDNARRISNVMDKLWEGFGHRAKDLKNRSYALSVYLFLEEMLSETDALSANEIKKFVQFVFALWQRLRQEAKAGFDRKNKELYTFERLLSSASGEKYQIERRHEKLKEYYDHFKRTGKIKGD